MKKKEMWDNARRVITDKVNNLKIKDYNWLLKETSEDGEQQTITIEDNEFAVTTWSRKEEDRLAVVVEARRSRMFGCSQVIAEGFFIRPDNTISELKEEDLWDLGY